MDARSAGCHCGQLELACAGEPKRVSMCHCIECQRRTGSAFSVAVFYERQKVRLVRGSPKTYERDSASGYPVAFHFCPQCGSNVWWEPARMPDLVGVALGAFGDPDFPQPEQSVWTQHRHAWLRLPDDCRVFASNPPPRKDPMREGKAP
ncbi:GFA family protein [Solimonas terrae]|uniref:GFA family protein n=2 Tax=Solimonas terrae TaxID=1396819 RepID=A0A6M2BMI9_9GAMM|nr:GFA family protein [Solimonas terrae]